ncbi:MAG TPA: GTP cyclohydrolase I FolE [Candidatus Hydrogenedentes bacterium]|jgi:GTP cyclohydrolase I|nr:MAG: GTP cyclohydrolase 1 [Candidatus Hydrogenedentes bacterium ADurb.Bin170]HNZ47691.1 GTP cyclohydrolase I FolE [Candidatus Hydrogenedentota bacterium]HOD95352.1 GTP cyclohydrolase I FolE [Candidatus Hydrogenedentota bacterium]HOH41496.1 GTP cyclohydrolase I FolE [Candidatus Hydrogenedentota bacterium]HOM47346.1 GTP cyclohydrolase I FolE [Candidatus Hydrogenedentota bacterium]
MNTDRIAGLIRELLIEIGEDPDREGLLKTPDRYAKALKFLTKGYHEDMNTIINGAIFQAESNNMIIMRDIELYSLCEHHMLPFFGRAHVGYIAQEKVIGLSKIARIVDFYARRLQIQERLTAQIARAIMDNTRAEGVGVVLECKHLCTMMRGVEKQNSLMTTSSVLGSFHDDEITRQEFLQLIGRGGQI